MATATFESVGFLTQETFRTYRYMMRKATNSKFDDIRIMKREELRSYINKVRNSKAYENVKANKYSPDEYLQVSKMAYANNLLRIKRQA